MSKISNYEELVLERKRVEGKMREQKAAINDRLSELVASVEPIFYVIPALNIFRKRAPSSSILKFITSLGIDLFVGQKLLSKANWFTRLTVPAVLKGISALALGKPKVKTNTHHELT